MRINSAELSISLALRSLNTIIAPDATSDAAQNAISNIRLTLTDLLKREGPGRDFLRECTADGLALCRQILQLLRSNNSALPTLPPASSDLSFESLAKIHGDLTDCMNLLLAQLLAEMPSSQRTRSLLREAAEWEQKYYTGLPAVPVLPFGEDPMEALEREPPLTAEFLKGFLRSSRQDNSIEVNSFLPVPGGYGNQTFFCSVTSRSGNEEIVVRKSDGVPISLCLEQEFDLVRILSALCMPVPKPFDLASCLPGIDGSFYTMSRLPGRMASSYVDGTKKTFDKALLMKLAEHLGTLHSIPLEKFSDYISTYNDTSVVHETIESRHRSKLVYWQKYSKDLYHPASPYVTWLFDWLKHNVPEDSRRPVLSHGDFNVHNVLVEGNVVTGILDWECADFGAPETDLSYIQHTVSAHMDWEQFLEHYYKHGGKKINPSNMLYCSVYAALRLALAAGRFSASLQSGQNRDIRFINVEQNLNAAIMAMGLTVTKANGDSLPPLHEAAVVIEPEKGGASLTTESLHVEFAK